MAPGFLERNVTFWGLVGAVMVALKMKDRYDEYQQVPADEEGLGHGPVALHSPVDPERGRDLPHLEIDTEIPAARPKRKARKDCCVCCGLKCGLFWKAFGIVCAFFFGWQLIKLAIWMVTPSPTGLEGMPAYSTSLGCANAKHIYNPDQTVYTIAVGPNGEHALDIRGGAYGTLLLTAGAPDAQDVELELVLRTDRAALLDGVALHVPAPADVHAGGAASRVRLATPAPGGACMRYDIVLRVPPTLKDLTIAAQSLTQLKFDARAEVALDSLAVRLRSPAASDRQLLLPAAGFRARVLALEAARGWLVGAVSVGERAALTTGGGDAVLNVHVRPAPADGDAPAVLTTDTGSGRADVFYAGEPGAPHRRIASTHRSARAGDLYLTYTRAEFNGRVDVAARAYAASGVMGMFNRTAGELPWVGDRDGGDRVTVRAPQGWVGLYF